VKILKSRKQVYPSRKRREMPTLFCEQAADGSAYRLRESRRADGAWIVLGNLVAHVFGTDEGLIVDLTGSQDGADVEPLASTYAFFAEVGSNEA
jgi:hypothetical protein